MSTVIDTHALPMVHPRDHDRSSLWTPEGENFIERCERSVDRAATLLDEHEPGWAGRVDLQNLDMMSCFKCVLGQIFDHEARRGADTGFEFGYWRSYFQPMLDGAVGMYGCSDFGFAFGCMTAHQFWVREITKRV